MHKHMLVCAQKILEWYTRNLLSVDWQTEKEADYFSVPFILS